MGKKKSKKKKEEGFLGHLERSTRDGIGAIASLTVGVLFLLAASGAAGMVGNQTYDFLFEFMGIGYYLIPLTAFILTAAFITTHAENVGMVRIIAVGVFFVSTLGLLSFLSTAQAGLLGTYLAAPLLWLFDVYAAFVILAALALISLIIIFEARFDSLKDFSLRRLSEQTRELFERMRGGRSKVVGVTGGGQQVQHATESTVTENERPSAEDESVSSNTAKSKSRKKGETSDDDEMMNILGNTSGKEYTPPPISLLTHSSGKPGVGDIKANANVIKRTLQNFNIDVEMDEISIGPTVTRYALKPAEGVRLSKIVGLQNNLELAMAAHPVRIEAPIPGKSLVGIEVPNTTKTTVGLSDLISSKEFQESGNPLQIALGQGVSGRSHFSNIGKMPHLLIAGATGSGKSVTIHTLTTSLLYRNAPENLKLIMVDPKRVELTLYNGIPHLLTPVITSAKKAILALKWAAKEMERRYDLLEENRVRDIGSYHKNVLSKSGKKNADVPNMPYIVVVIDELADLMSAYPRELESTIVRLAQMSRAVGIHLVLSTQRPSVNVITGLIKANVPARIALQVASQVDSRTILDGVGAEKLLGAGDMLYQSGEMSKPVRIQSAFISEAEVKSVVDHLKNEYEDELPDQVDIEKDESDAKTIFDIAEEAEAEEDRDDLYEEARDIVINAGKASTSYLQRKLRIGYSRAARIMDTLEENGVISEKDGTKPRDVLVSKEDLQNAHDSEISGVGSESDEEPVDDQQEADPATDDGDNGGSEEGKINSETDADTQSVEETQDVEYTPDR